MEAVNREMPSRGQVFLAAFFVIATLVTMLVLLAGVLFAAEEPGWFEYLMCGVLAAFMTFYGYRQIRSWWLVARDWPKAIARRAGMHTVRKDPAQLVFVRNPELEWSKCQAKFERLERVNQLARAVPGNVQDLGGVSLRQALACIESALNGFDSDREVAELVEDEVLQLLHARVVRAVIRELAAQVCLGRSDRTVLSSFMEYHDAQLTRDRIDVHHAADPVGMIRDACATVLTQPNSPVVTHEPM